jgi:hypothetical protein
MCQLSMATSDGAVWDESFTLKATLFKSSSGPFEKKILTLSLAEVCLVCF